MAEDLKQIADRVLELKADEEKHGKYMRQLFSRAVWGESMTPVAVANYMEFCCHEAPDLARGYLSLLEENRHAVHERDQAIKEAARRDEKWMTGINQACGMELSYDAFGPNVRTLTWFVDTLHRDKKQMVKQIAELLEENQRLREAVDRAAGMLENACKQSCELFALYGKHAPECHWDIAEELREALGKREGTGDGHD